MSERAYVLSDLHIGAGLGDPLEGFTSDDSLAAFLDAIAGPRTTLIINGDFIDFARIEPLDVTQVPDSLLWDEAASLTKLQIALDGHKDAFAGLARFLQGGGRMQVSVGNHDLDFAWPQVQEKLRLAMGATHTQMEFSTRPLNFAGVHIEHGHQFTPENCPTNPDGFIHRWRDGRYLERVWGTDFLVSFFNRLQQRYPYADKVKPALLVAYHALRNGWIPWSALVRMAVFLKRRGIPWEGVVSAVLNGGDVAPRVLLSTFDDGDSEWRQLAAYACSRDPDGLAEAIAALDDRDRVILSLPKRIVVGSNVDSREGTLGVFREDREIRAARERLSHDEVTHVVFGHTHQVITDGLDRSHFNPGTWIPHLNLRDPAVAANVEARGVSEKLLSDATLFSVSRCAVVINPDRHRARVEVIETS